MANESYKESEEVYIVNVSNEELQNHLIKSGYNIDIGTVTFEEKDLQYEMSKENYNVDISHNSANIAENLEYTTSNDTYDVNINSSNNSTDSTDNNSESSGVVQNAQTEFVADGKANIVTMLDPRFMDLNKERKSNESNKKTRDDRGE